jgi:hypothetical protein
MVSDMIFLNELFVISYIQNYRLISGIRDVHYKI